MRSVGSHSTSEREKEGKDRGDFSANDVIPGVIFSVDRQNIQECPSPQSSKEVDSYWEEIKKEFPAVILFCCFDYFLANDL